MASTVVGKCRGASTAKKSRLRFILTITAVYLFRTSHLRFWRQNYSDIVCHFLDTKVLGYSAAFSRTVHPIFGGRNYCKYA